MTISTVPSLVSPVPSRRARSWSDSRLPSSRSEQPGYTQGALALTFALPSGLEGEPLSTALTLVQPGATHASDFDESEAWAARFLQAVVEVVSSDRPLTQLARWTDSTVYAEIARRKSRVAARKPGTARTGRPHVVTVHICHPVADTAEVSARVTMGGRSRAIAARLEARCDRWLCTAIQFG